MPGNNTGKIYKLGIDNTLNNDRNTKQMLYCLFLTAGYVHITIYIRVRLIYRNETALLGLRIRSPLGR